jgi:hypothetical protein
MALDRNWIGEKMKTYLKYINEGYQTRSLFDHVPNEYMSTKKLTVPVRKKINGEIQKILKPTYFDAIPLQDIMNVLKKFGIVILQEDFREWSGLLLGGVSKTEMVNFNLGWKDQWGPDNSGKSYMVIPNVVFTMTYFKMPSGRYEVVGYIS